MNATRCITVWIVTVSLGMETIQLQSCIFQVIGFIFLILGNLTYNEVIEWKFWGLNKNLSKYDVSVKIQ